jgi:GIY-YIG catalytic domain
VYVVRDNELGRVVYVGRTNNFVRRFSEWRQGRYSDPERFSLLEVAQTDERLTQRAVEQNYMDAYRSASTDLPQDNKIRSVALKTWIEVGNEIQPLADAFPVATPSELQVDVAYAEVAGAETAYGVLMNEIAAAGGFGDDEEPAIEGSGGAE